MTISNFSEQILFQNVRVQVSRMQIRAGGGSPGAGLADTKPFP